MPPKRSRASLSSRCMCSTCATCSTGLAGVELVVRTCCAGCAGWASGADWAGIAVVWEVSRAVSMRSVDVVSPETR